MRAKSLRQALLAGAMAAVASLTLGGLAAHAAGPDTVRWQVDADRGYSADVVQFTLRGQGGDERSVISSPSSLNVLSGLTAAQLRSSTPQHVAFKVQRDAGEFDCEGTAQDQHASGECRFQGSQSFAQLLQARGVGRANTDELYQMTVHNVGADYVAELHGLRVTPTVEELSRAGQHGVS
ncbi:MAG: hypothetical protein JSR98_02505, partial [Proteobacteria bacterium]|nr:hypothetical protein [Pseudomonadota bacterium]